MRMDYDMRDIEKSVLMEQINRAEELGAESQLSAMIQMEFKAVLCSVIRDLAEILSCDAKIVTTFPLQNDEDA